MCTKINDYVNKICSDPDYIDGSDGYKELNEFTYIQ